MNEGLIQAIIVLIRVFVVTGLGAVASNLTILNGTLGNQTNAVFAIAVIGAAISAVLKYLGGATTQAEGRARARLGAHTGGRPNILSV